MKYVILYLCDSCYFSLAWNDQVVGKREFEVSIQPVLELSRKLFHFLNFYEESVPDELH